MEIMEMNSLDLHGTRHSDVEMVLDMFIWDNMKRDEVEGFIITGMSSKMQEIVKETIYEHKMTYEEVFGNPGMIKIIFKDII